jgi:hypothetical protein
VVIVAAGGEGDASGCSDVTAEDGAASGEGADDGGVGATDAKVAADDAGEGVGDAEEGPIRPWSAADAAGVPVGPVRGPAAEGGAPAGVP